MPVEALEGGAPQAGRRARRARPRGRPRIRGKAVGKRRAGTGATSERLQLVKLDCCSRRSDLLSAVIICCQEEKLDETTSQYSRSCRNAAAHDRASCLRLLRWAFAQR